MPHLGNARQVELRGWAQAGEHLAIRLPGAMRLIQEAPGLWRQACASGRAAGFERGERDRLTRGAIGPQHELERLVIGLAGVEGCLDHRAALRVARDRAPDQAYGVANPHQSLLAPLVKTPEPQLFIDELRQFAYR